jgi:hypothetical protein
MLRDESMGRRQRRNGIVISMLLSRNNACLRTLLKKGDAYLPE